MKISVQFEADSADDYDRILEALSGPGRAMFHGKHIPTIGEQHTFARADAEDRAKARFVEAKTVEPEPVTEEPVLTPHTEEPAEKPKRGRKPKMAPVTEEPEDEPTEAPVAAPEAPKTNGKETVSRQDLLDVFAEYVQRYSANYGYTDISNLLQQNFGGNVRKASDVPEDMLGKAVAAIRAAITDNPFNRKRDYA